MKGEEGQSAIEDRNMYLLDAKPFTLSYLIFIKTL